MMGYRYWTIGRQRTAEHEAPGTQRPTRRNDGFDPEPEPPDGCLPMSTAVPLWGVLSVFGWVMIAYTAVYLAYLVPYLRAATPQLAATEMIEAETPILVTTAGYAQR
jgi:hypothetical protein